MTTTPRPDDTSAPPPAASRAPSTPNASRVPLSVGQEAMWVSWKLDPGQWTHIIPTPFRVRGTLDVNRLRLAVDTLGEAHPQLCARVVETPDGPAVDWADAQPIPVVEHTVNGGIDEETRRIWRRPFDLRRGPLARVDVLHGPGWTVLLPSVHHLVFDGASILLLLDRLRSAYAGEPLDAADPAAVLTAFAARSRELTHTPAGDTHRAHWREVLGGELPALALPGSVDEPGHAVLDTALDPGLVARLRTRAQELGISYVTVLFGAYFALLRRYCGQEDLLASVPFHGRVDPATRETVGYFVNALPVRQRVRGGDSYATVFASLRGTLRAAMTHGELPLPAILREAGLTGWESRARTHGTVFQYWNAGLRADVDVRDLRLRTDGGACALTLLAMESSADYTLAVMVREDSGGTHVLWKDPGGAVGATLLRMMADDYTRVLEAVADDPEAAVDDFTDPVTTAHGPVRASGIAELIGSHPAVRSAVVTPTGGGAELHARLTVDASVSADEALAPVRAEFGERAPVIRVETVRRPAAAPEPVPADAVTPAVADMVRLWEEVLRVDGIAPDDSFFELGGHSLLAESLVIAVGDGLGRDVPLRALFEYPRLRDFVAHLDAGAAPAAPAGDPDPAVPDSVPEEVPEHGEREGAGEPVGSGEREEDAFFPAAAFQQRIWLAERVDPGTGTYNVPLAWRVPGAPLRPEALARALELLVARHEILRTRFVEHGGRLRQQVGEEWRPRLDHVDLRGHEDRGSALRDWLDRAAGHRFDPAGGRLLTAALLETDEGEQTLFVCLHHLVWDGESAGAFLGELSDCYDEAAADPVTAEDPATPDPVTDSTAADPAGPPRPSPDAAAPGTAPADHTLHPASAHQERIAFIDRFEKGSLYPASPVYHNLPLFLRLDRAPTTERLQEAVDQVVAAHEALRTDLTTTDDRTVQRVHRHARVVAHWFDPDPDPDPGPDPENEEPGGEVPGTLRRWASESFDLDRGPLLRVAVVRPSPGGTTWLALLGHQAVVDRTSLLVVAEDLLAALNGAATTGSSYHAWLAARPERDRRTDLDTRAEDLRGDTDPLRLPERRPRAAVHVYREQSVPLLLPDDLPVTAFAERHGLTRQDVHLAVFAALLGWYSGQEEMVVGVAHHGRGVRDRRVVGPLANLLPLRLLPRADATFDELAMHVGAELAGARKHELAWFDELVRRLDPAKDMSRTALFDVLFTWADDPAPLTSPDGAAVGTVEPGGGHGKYDLHLFLRPDGRGGPDGQGGPGGQGCAGRLVFNALYFDEAQMRLMAEHYVRLLHILLAEPHRPVGAAEPLTGHERRTQLAVWNATDAAYPETTLHGLLRDRAVNHPEAVALTDATDEPARHHTYGELLERAELLAAGLVAHGVLPGELVALLLPRGVAQIEAMLAVLMAGGAYLPLDPALPDGRKEFILADSGARRVVVPDTSDGKAAAATVPDAYTGEILAAGVLEAAARRSQAPAGPLPGVGPDAPAYCIYTSGTTGRPKGVVISHRNAVRLIDNDRLPLALGPADVWTMFHSYAFDFSVWELFCGLAHGGRVVLVPEDDSRDPRRFWQLLRRERVTVLNQTPSAFRQLLSAEQEEPDPLDHLRYLVLGGEQLAPALLAPWLDRHPRVRPVNMYGITETTVHVTAHTVTPADAERGNSVIGTPLPTTTVHLLDRRSGRRLLPVGAVGEMYVGGAGVADGYHHRPELDAERFVPNPFGPGRLFRTGDLARYRPDGVLEFLGRADSQVQLRGFRIEPGEIEARLREHPAVADAAVLMEDDRLVGYLLAPDEAPSAAELRTHLGATLPEYMLPAALRTVDALPLTANGKLDTHALRASAVALETPGGRAPATSTATELAGLWARLLDLERVGADDSFFALGGHSMLGVRMLGEVRARLGVTVPLRSLFERPRLQDFADLVDETGTPRPPRPLPTGDSARRAVTAAPAPPASGFQERLWLAERHAQDTAHNIVLAWRAPEGLDHAVLRRALALLVDRHEILRTAFTEDGGRLRQYVTEPWAPPLDHIDLRGAADAEQDLRAWLRTQAALPFDPESGRLLRPALADLGTRGHALLLCLHHLVVDGESIPALLTELGQCYRAVEEGVRLPEPALQYRDFTAAQEAERGDARRVADLAYWTEHLAGAPAGAVFPVPEHAEPHGAIPLVLPDDLAARLHPVQQEHGLSWFMVVAGALAAVLHRTTGRPDLTFGVPASLRDRAEFAGLLGPCLNTVVLRSRPAHGATLLDLLRTMRTEVLDAHEHRGAPFEDVLERLNPVREPGRAPYIDITLNMNLLTGRTAALGRGTLTPLLVEPGRRETKFGITVTLIEQDGRLSGVLSHRGDRVAPAEAARLAHRLAALLTALPSVLDLPLDRLAPDRDPSATAPAARPDDTARRTQYRDFVMAQEAERGGERRAEDLAYWEEHLAGAPQYLDFPAPAAPGPNASVAVPLPADLLERMRPVQRQYDFTPYQLAAGALAALLHRWTGRDDVVVATPLTHRDRPEFAGLLGPCLNTVLLRSRPADDATLLDLLRAVRTEALDAYEHGGAPFEEVVERLNPARRPGRTPYADVTLSLETEPDRPARLAGSPLIRLPLAGEGAGHLGKLGLTVVLSLHGGTLGAGIAYRGDRYRRADVEQLAVLFGRLLTALPTTLDTRVDALDLLGGQTDAAAGAGHGDEGVGRGEAERLADWENGGEPALATSVPALVAHWIRHTPDAPAVETTDGVLSYRALHTRAEALAARIRPHLRPEDPVVALLLDRGADLIVAMLATWYAGAAFCPVDPATPPARVDAILTDLDACAVLTADRRTAAGHGTTGATVLTVAATQTPGPRPAAPVREGASASGAPGAGPATAECGAHPDAPRPGAPEVPSTDPRATAYVVHTSGTTGEPKGVAVRHSGLAQLALWGRESFALGPGDRVGQLLGVSFDATQWDVWSALANGACVVPYEGPLAVGTLPGWLDDRWVSVVLLATPLAESVWAADPPLPHLRWMIVGAAALTRRPPSGTGYRVRNAYGPTESTVIALTHDLDAEAEGPLNVLGRPVTGTRARILDPYGGRCPVGVTGEIVLSGSGTAAGYWRRPELTRARFGATGPGDGAPTEYRTGDRGRRLPDGTIEYLGRLDRQLKIRGHRIEPSEIETALLRHPAVAAAVVHGDPQASPSLVAYLVPADGPRPTTVELLEGLRSRLPSHLVPEAVVWLAALPLTTSGKVDPTRLPRPGRADLPVAAVRVAPSGDTETLIAAAWSEVLGLAEIGAHDNFFDLGGNSLTLAALHALLVERLGAPLPLVALFEHPTVAALARSLTARAAPPAASRTDAFHARAARARQAASRGAAAARAGRARATGQPLPGDPPPVRPADESRRKTDAEAPGTTTAPTGTPDTRT
ncbi:amino acid adenylation domain-containing protein [Streptomyces sp. NPDC002409]